MKNLIFVILSITILMSCSSPSIDMNTDRGKDGLKGKVVCVFMENHGSGTKSIKEYSDNGTKIRVLTILTLFNVSFVESTYNYSNNILVGIDNVQYLQNGKVIEDSTPLDSDDKYRERLKGLEFFDIKLDSKGNWIERSILNGDGDKIKSSRKIYYKGEDFSHIVSEFESVKSSLISPKKQIDNQNNQGQWIPCNVCNGKGYELCRTCNGLGIVGQGSVCKVCSGRGTRDVFCKKCDGNGSVYVKNPY